MSLPIPSRSYSANQRYRRWTRISYWCCPLLAVLGWGWNVYANEAPSSWKTADYTSSRPEVCTRHFILTRETKVEILYGMISSLSSVSPKLTTDLSAEDYGQYRDDLAKDFPYADPRILGGCTIDNHSPRFARVRVCDECLEAKDVWVNRLIRSKITAVQFP